MQLGNRETCLSTIPCTTSLVFQRPETRHFIILCARSLLFNDYFFIISLVIFFSFKLISCIYLLWSFPLKGFCPSWTFHINKAVVWSYPPQAIFKSSDLVWLGFSINSNKPKIQTVRKFEEISWNKQNKRNKQEMPTSRFKMDPKMWPPSNYQVFYRSVNWRW